jgi:hypothetical protein
VHVGKLVVRKRASGVGSACGPAEGALAASCVGSMGRAGAARTSTPRASIRGGLVRRGTSRRSRRAARARPAERSLTTTTHDST